jgi:hypothetical protein
MLTDAEIESIEAIAEETAELAALHSGECSKDYHQVMADFDQYEDDRIRSPDYLQPKHLELDPNEPFHASITDDPWGKGAPGRIFNSSYQHLDREVDNEANMNQGSRKEA